MLEANKDAEGRRRRSSRVRALQKASHKMAEAMYKARGSRRRRRRRAGGRRAGGGAGRDEQEQGRRHRRRVHGRAEEHVGRLSRPARALLLARLALTPALSQRTPAPCAADRRERVTSLAIPTGLVYFPKPLSFAPDDRVQDFSVSGRRRPHGNPASCGPGRYHRRGGPLRVLLRRQQPHRPGLSVQPATDGRKLGDDGVGVLQDLPCRPARARRAHRALTSPKPSANPRMPA